MSRTLHDFSEDCFKNPLCSALSHSRMGSHASPVIPLCQALILCRQIAKFLLPLGPIDIHMAEETDSHFTSRNLEAEITLRKLCKKWQTLVSGQFSCVVSLVISFAARTCYSTDKYWSKFNSSFLPTTTKPIF